MSQTSQFNRPMLLLFRSVEFGDILEYQAEQKEKKNKNEGEKKLKHRITDFCNLHHICFRYDEIQKRKKTFFLCLFCFDETIIEMSNA